MRRSFLIGLLLFLVGSQACYHREPVEFYYEDMAQIRLEVDWLNHMEEKPSGMTVMLAKDSDAFTFQRVTNNVDSMYLRLEAGTYRLLILSYAFDEFSSLHFEDQGSFSGVLARADILTSRMNQAWDRGIVYRKNPDILGVATDTLTVTREDIEKNRHFIDWRSRQTPDTISIVRRETVYPLTSRLNLYVRVQGYKFMRSLEGSISGMADGCRLSSFLTTDEEGPLLLDSWTHRVGTRQEVMAQDNRTKADDPLPQADTLSHDWLCTSIPVFGLPGTQAGQMSDRDPEKNILTLCFTLIDGTSHVYRFNVGNWLRIQQSALNHQLINMVVDLPQGVVDLPYAEDPGSSSGSASSFDVLVDDWEEGETVDVGL